MNREEAIDIAFRHKDMIAVENYQSNIVDGIWILRMDVVSFVDKIYDDFESRTCENCEHRIEMVYCDILFTDTDGIENLWVHKDFGCNKFERKQND